MEIELVITSIKYCTTITNSEPLVSPICLHLPPSLVNRGIMQQGQASLDTLGTTQKLRLSSLRVIQEQMASRTRHTSISCPSFLKEGLSHVPRHLKAPTPQKKTKPKNVITRKRYSPHRCRSVKHKTLSCLYAPPNDRYETEKRTQ